MVEKIIVNPNEVRGYGNIHEATSVSDWSKYESKLTKTTDTVDGATTPVFQLKPITFTLTFDSASYTTGDGNLTVYVTVYNDEMTTIPNVTVTITGAGSGTGTTNISGVATINVTGITASGTLTATYEAFHATATVTYQTTTYSLAFSQSTYTTEMLEGVTVSCTLTNGGVAMSGETVTFTYEGILGPVSNTATTNSSGVAIHYFDYWDIGSYPVTITATYDTASATCTIVE